MRIFLWWSLLILSTSCGCESEVRRSAQEVAGIVREAKQKPESMDALHKLVPYLNQESAFVRRWACQSLGEIYDGTQNDEIASNCASILCEELDAYREGEVNITKHAARALLRIGLPSGHPDTEAIEIKLRKAAKDLLPTDATLHCMDALAIIENPSEQTFDTLVECLHYVPGSNAAPWWRDHVRHHAASALARFGSRASVVLPDLKEALAETSPNTWAHREIRAAIETIEEIVAKEHADSRQ